MNLAALDPRPWLARLQPREQLMVLAGAALGAVLIVAGGLWRLHSAVAAAETRIANKTADLAWMQAVAPQVRAAQATAGTGDEPLALLLDRTAREAGLDGAIAGTEPAGPTAVRVRITAASFDALVAWLGALQTRYRVDLRSATIERTEGPGLVNASLMLDRS